MEKPLGENLALYPDWIDPGGSCFLYFLGNTSNEGMKCAFGLKQLKTVTRDPRSAD